MYVARKHPELLEEDDLGDKAEKSPVNLYKLRGLGETMSDSFTLFRALIGRIVGNIFWIVTPMVVFIMVIQSGNYAEDMGLRHFYDWVIQMRILFGYNLENGTDLLVFCLWAVIIAITFASIFFTIQHKDEKTRWVDFLKFLVKNFHWLFLGNLIIYLVVFGLPWYLLMWATFLIPLFYIQPAVFGLDERPAGTRWTKSWSYSANRYGTSLMAIMMSIFIVFIVSQPIAFIFSFHEPFNDEPLVRDLLDLLADTVKRVAMIYTDEHIYWSNIARQIVYLLFSFMVIIFMGIMMAVSYYSAREKEEAVTLKEAYKRFGKRSRLNESQVDFE
jgi:putative flippase GtrA